MGHARRAVARLARRAIGQPTHPILTTPVSLRLARRPLALVIAAYVAASLAAACLAAALMTLLHRPSWSFGHAFRVAFAALWGLENLLGEGGQPTAYYVVAGAVSVTGILLPLFLLGSFVFKLLRHDPIRWRKKLSLEDEANHGAVLSVRFYPGSTSALGDLTVRVYARISYAQDSPRTIVNRPLDLIYAGRRTQESRIPYSSSGFPCTVRIPLSKRRSAIDTEVTGMVDVQGEDLSTSDVEIMAIVAGAILDSGESFVSIRRYHLATDLLVGQPQWVDAVEDGQPRKWLGWDNFENNADLVLFVYGSMVNRESMQKTLPSLAAECGPTIAYLKGWVRAWNAGSNPADQPERTWYDGNGSQFRGTIASLGLIRQEGGECPGAIYQIGVRDLALVDRRERDYARVNVTGMVQAPGLNPQATVITYVPKEAAERRLRSALSRGDAVLSKNYIRLTEAGFDALLPDGSRLYHQSTPRFPGRIERLSFVTTDPTRVGPHPEDEASPVS